MKTNILTALALATGIFLASCGASESNQVDNNTDSTTSTSTANNEKPADNNRRRGIDYTALKAELALNPEQEKQFEEVVEKYKKIAEESRAAATSGGAKFDRVEAFKQMEERSKKQAADMAVFLNDTQLEKYNAFMAKNTRKRPRYNDELLSKIKTELALDEKQAAMLEAVNNAFERSYHEAHDIYHGNSELAKEYWLKYDDERKGAMKKVLSEAQYAKFLELVKDQKPAERAEEEPKKEKKDKAEQTASR
ncbi:hypothetical protein [Eisenibacter elegans]|uniref:hypothetical protein n=1 Tax=Eisenibacter elegans TaxID=997 RepID=UPI0004142171|nr:hypothetical protein [Eisenibacter elegans]